MKNLFFYLAVSVMILSCNQKAATSDASSENNDAKALYEKNLGILKTGITAFENEQIDAWASTVADSAVWIPASYGAPTGNKEDWKKTLASFMANWDSLQLKDANFLPGIDSITHEFDGSVRYYGKWEGVHKSGVRTSSNFYGTYEFNKDGKIIFASDFFDIGGLMNAVAGKKAMPKK